MRERGHSLVELIAVLVILGVLGAVAAPKFFNASNAAYEAHIRQVQASLESGYRQVMAAYMASGSPGRDVGGATVVELEGIPVRFNRGQVRTTENSNHVPVIPQNRNAAYTRLFFLFLDAAPGEIVRRDANQTGWAMLGNNQSCAAGAGQRRCWEYRVRGARLARLTFFSRTGEFVRD